MIPKIKERKRKRKQRAIKKSNQKRRKDNKTLSQKSEKGIEKKNLTKGNKRKELKIKVLTHELLASTLSYLMLVPWRYTNPSNLSSRTHPMSSLVVHPMSSLVVLCLSSYYWFVLLPHYELVPPRDSVACPNHLKRYCMSFSSTCATPSLSRMSSFWTQSLLM
jgi:hypothetical protein